MKKNQTVALKAFFPATSHYSGLSVIRDCVFFLCRV